MKIKEIPQKKSFGLYVWHEIAYIPSRARFDSGIYVDIDPVHVVRLQKDPMVNAIKSVISMRIQDIPSPKTREEFLARKDPILAATGARSWKELAKTGYSYSIDWPGQHVRIDMSRLDKQGRWEFDPNKTRIMAPDTPLEDIIDIIIKDVNERNKQDP